LSLGTILDTSIGNLGCHEYDLFRTNANK